MKYSLTMAGALVSVFGVILVQVGFSESCSNEIMTLAPVFIGGVMTWLGRFRNGGVDMLGRKL